MTAESKRVGQSYIHFTLLSLVERKVQVIVDVFVCLLYTSDAADD